MVKFLDELDVVKKAEKQTETNISCARQNFYSAEEEYKRQLKALKKMTSTYLETGVGRMDNRASYITSAMGFRSGKTYFEALAKELDRPLLYADNGNTYLSGSYTYRSYIQLTVPRNVRSENLVAGLLITAKSCDEPEWAASSLAVHTSDRKWDFYFIESEGKEMYEDFLNMLRESPVARILLKLTPGVK